MKVRIDQDDDAIYFELDDGEIIESQEVHPGVILDFAKDGRFVGIEILGKVDQVLTWICEADKDALTTN